MAHHYTVQTVISAGFCLSENTFSLCSAPSSFYVPFPSLNLPKIFMTCNGFSILLQYYMHARHLALSRTFPVKFEMEPSAPPTVKSAFGDEFILITLQGERKSVREKRVSKLGFN